MFLTIFSLTTAQAKKISFERYSAQRILPKIDLKVQGSYKRLSGGPINCNYFFNIYNNHISFVYPSNCQEAAVKKLDIPISKSVGDSSKFVLYYSKKQAFYIEKIAKKQTYKLYELVGSWHHIRQEIVWTKRPNSIVLIKY